MKSRIITLFLVISFMGTIVLFSRQFRVSQIPNGSVNSCLNCHMSQFGGDARNDFGKLVETRFLSSPGAAGNVQWGPLLASLDADNDGVTNGQELQDPYGMWSSGSSNPGNSDLVSEPGNSSSSPLSSLEINFSGMTPHVDQTLYLRIIDKLNGTEVGRTSTQISESFNLSLDVIIPGRSYTIDFFADHNENGLYDSPPVDHAWRWELDDAQEDDVINFEHNTDFTDIDWKYLFTLNLTGMTPHLDQLLEIRVEDDLTSEEVGRKRIEFIPQANFSVSIPGLELNKEYKVEFYADHNGNGIYDAPTTDHAWELEFQSTNGDSEVAFPHNTNFTDIEWKYLYTLNLVSMTPHLGQKFELRIYRGDNQEELGRATIDEIPGEDFSVSIPQIETEHNYVVDFYADHNGNGEYDAPPTDHAWRLNFNSSTGNFVQNFTHNTEFTNIEWPGISSVGDQEVPLSYDLKQNYPNPFNPSTTISFSIPSAGTVTLEVYDILGREAAVLLDREMNAGKHNVTFDASSFESGVYIYRIQSVNFTASKKMILLK